MPQLRRERQHYQLIWQEGQEGKETNIFVKMGQYPPLSVAPSPELVKAHGPEDARALQKGLTDFNFGDGSYASLTGKREIENDLHPRAIEQALGVAANFADTDNVPVLVSEAIHDAALEHKSSWGQLEENRQKEKIKNAKYRLNENAASRMTYAMLEERDP